MLVIKLYYSCVRCLKLIFLLWSQVVERWLADRAVLPIENSLGGSIHRNYDLLLRYNLHIVGEVKHAVRHCLLANHGVKKQDLKRVLSHPQAQLSFSLACFFPLHSILFFLMIKMVCHDNFNVFRLLLNVRTRSQNYESSEKLSMIQLELQR